MQFIKRLGYYLGGFAIGLIILAFFFSGKRTSCAYFPEARVVKNIKNKPFTLSAKAQATLSNLALDTLAIQSFYTTADVDFSESNPRQEPCGSYWLSGILGELNDVRVQVFNCDSVVSIEEIKRSN